MTRAYFAAGAALFVLGIATFSSFPPAVHPWAKREVKPLRIPAGKGGLREKADFETWKAALLFQIRTTGRYDYLLQLDLLARLSRENPGVDTSRLLTVAGPMHDQIDFFAKGQTDAAGFIDLSRLKPVFEKGVELGKKLPGEAGLIFEASDYARKWAERETEEYFKELAPRDLEGRMREGVATERFDAASEANAFIGQLGAQMQKDVALSGAVGVVTQELMAGVGPGSTAPQILEKLPLFSQNTQIQRIYQKVMGGDFPSERTLREIVSEEMRRALSSVEQKRQSIVAKETGKPAPIQNELEKARKMREERLEVEGARATAQIVSQVFVWMGNPQAARLMQSSVEVFTRVREGVEIFNTSFGAGRGAQTQAMGAMVMASNFMGAANLLLSVFAEQKNPDQMILEQLGKMTEELKALRKDLASYFASVDSRLDEMMRKINEGFAALSEQGAWTQSEVRGLSESLGSIERQIFGVEKRLTDQLGSLGLQSLYARISSCTKNRLFQELGETWKDSRECMDAFVAYATALAAGQTEARDYGGYNEDLWGRSRDWPIGISSHLTELNSFSSARFGETLVDSRVLSLTEGAIPAPLMWSLSTEALISYIDREPLALLGLNSETLEKLAAGGTLFNQMATNLTQGKGVLSAALDGFDHRIDLVQEQLATYVDSWEKQHVSGLKLRGGATQQSSVNPYVLPERLPRCSDFQVVQLSNDGVPSEITAPRILADAFPAETRLAQILGQGNISACVQNLGWIEVHDCNTDPGRWLGRECGTWGVVVRGYSADTPVFEWTISRADVERSWTIRSGIVSKWLDPVRAYNENWLSLIGADFHQGMKILDPGLKTVQSRVSAKLEQEEEKLYSELISPNPTDALGRLWRKGLIQSDIDAAVLRSFVFIGLGQSVVKSDFIRSLVFSGDGAFHGIGDVLGTGTERTLASLDLWAQREKSKVHRLREFLIRASDRRTLPESHPWVSASARKIAALQEKKKRSTPSDSLSDVLALISKRAEQATSVK